MTAREFVRKYERAFGMSEKDMLQLLDGFLSEMVITNAIYAETPDEELVEFIEHENLEEDFENWLRKELKRS